MERTVTGIAAAPGIWTGTAFHLANLDGLSRKRGTPDAEALALTTALAAALAEVIALAEAQDGEAADMLAFQAAMLSDDALAEPAFAAIDGGAAVEAAWRVAMDAEMAGYESSDDEYFRARAADLADIRDRVLAALFDVSATAAIPAGAVIVADELKPSQFLTADWSKGGAIALGRGSPSSHVAMLARGRGVPMVAGLGAALTGISGMLVVDGRAGTVISNPDAASLASSGRRASEDAARKAEALSRLLEPAVTRNGTPIKVLVNVATFTDLGDLDAGSVDGIGLVRTEFLVEQALHDEERQYAHYRALLEWAGGRPVTIRTFDAGGDKPVPGYTVGGESNPFLGMRGIRLSLQHPDVFKVQLRAILRASAHGIAKLMLPMVTSPHDLEAARELLHVCRDELNAAGVAHAMPDLGIMVEVPAVALAPDIFDAAFYSIGSNDLTQYATAAGRDSTDAARWADVTHPGVLAMIAHVTRHGAQTGREVSLCGDAGGDPALIGHLLRAGVRCVSVAPGLVAMAKAAIRAVDLGAREEAA